MNNKILSLQDLQEMESYVARFNSAIVQFYTKFDKLLNNFNDAAVVESFYQSGILGSNQRERLLLLRQSVEEYINSITDGPESLMGVIKRFISEQKDYVSMQTLGYSMSDSVTARRVGNQG